MSDEIRKFVPPRLPKAIRMGSNVSIFLMGEVALSLMGEM